MTHQVTIHWQGQMFEVSAEHGDRLIDILARAGVVISAPCGGRCFCGKCRVRVQGDAGEISPAELRFLSQKEIASGWRLACAGRAHSDMIVRADDDAVANVLVEGRGESGFRVNPSIKLLIGQIDAPTLDDQRSDLDRLLDAIGEADASVDWKLLEAIPRIIRESATVQAVAFVCRGDVRILCAAPRSAHSLGVAVDIGTTTMAAYLMDMTTGAQLAAASMLNPQRLHGGDVISRAEYTAHRAGGAEEMAALVRGAIDGMTRQMIRQAGVDASQINHFMLAGNTVMMHLIAKLEVKYIARLPFVPVYTRTMHMPAAQIGLPYDGAMATLAPCVSGYVGADTIAALLACDMDEGDGISLMIDIGTNGEIALGGRERMLCCSAAAGPAFEGAHIRCGSGAVPGAIDSVAIAGGNVEITTIGSGEPSSICGSGIVDAVAQMLAAGIIDETGRIDEDEIPAEYEGRLFKSDAGLAFKLSENVFICQKDIREVQLAKSAIAAGIEILLEAAGVGAKDVQKLYLAGGFGNFIDKKNACEIGLLPKTLIERIIPIGNGAGAGARKMLLDSTAIERGEALRRRMEYIELSASANFQEYFSENMLFDQ